MVAQQRVIAVAAIKRIIANRCLIPPVMIGAHQIIAAIALEVIIGGIAIDRVITRSAKGVLDQRTRITLILQGIVEIAGRVNWHSAMIDNFIIIEFRELCLREDRRGAGREIDCQIGFVIGQVIGVLAATIPDGAENTIGAGLALPLAIDEHLAAVRIETVDRVVAVGVEIRAIEKLDRLDVEHHQRLRKTIVFVAVSQSRRGIHIAPIGHHTIFHAVKRG